MWSSTEQHIRGVHDESSQDELPPVIPEDIFQWSFDAFVLLNSTFENRGLFQRNTYPQADSNQHDRG